MSAWALVRSEDERSRFELVRDDAVLGRLEWEGMTRRRAVLSAGGASWRIARAGILRPGFEITEAATGTTVGSFSLGRKSTFEVPPKAYRWRRVSVPTGWRALQRDGEEVARFQARGVGRERVRIEVADAVAADAQPLPLVLLACCFVAVVQRDEDDGAAAAGAAAASG
jgi:hypothetical protein